MSKSLPSLAESGVALRETNNQSELACIVRLQEETGEPGEKLPRHRENIQSPTQILRVRNQTCNLFAAPKLRDFLSSLIASLMK